MCRGAEPNVFVNNHTKPKNYIMRKFALFLILMMGLGFVACEQPDVEEVAPAYPSPEAVIADDEACTPTAIAILFDGNAAFRAGAKSFTSTLTPESGAEPISLTKLTNEPNACKHVHTGIPGDVYTVFVFATYPDGTDSESVYLTDSKGQLVKFRIGVKLSKPEITSAVTTTDGVIVKWNSVSGASDYILEYKLSSAEEYTAIEVGKVLDYTISGLDEETEYSVRLKAIDKATQSKSEYSDVVTVKTLLKASFPMVANNADEFIAILSNPGLRTATAADEVRIMSNLDFTGKTLPESPFFTGTLVGNNHVISGVVSDHPLFASVHSAKDLTIDESCAFTSTKAGLLAALTAEATGTISNVVNKAAVTLNMTTATDTSIAVAGIVAVSDAGLENCKNFGAVTYTNTAASHGGLVAGLAGYCQGAVSKCENNGKVTMSVPYLSDFGAVKSISNNPIHIGGLVAYLGANAPVSECTNNGAIDYDITHIEKIEVSCGTNRPRMGGIVGMAQSSITKSTNTGKIDVLVTTSNQSVYTDKNYPINVGGISGGAPSDESGATGADITECTNTGALNCVSFCSGTRPTCGGIVAYPGYEDHSQTNLITRCENKGEMVVVAHDKIRVGGIIGGTGNVTYCKNYGAIKGNIQKTDGVIGGITGFLSQGHKFEYNENYGALSNNRGANNGTADMGGLIGQHGDYDSYPGEGRGCIVNCDITYDWSNYKWFGPIIGWYEGSSTIVFGTPEEPVKILGGSLTCTAGTVILNEETYQTYAKASGSHSYTVHVKFGE